jgi:hypothetical protein
MTWRGQGWECWVPVEDIEVPIVYFVAVESSTPQKSSAHHGAELAALPEDREIATNVSPMRVCRPHLLGLKGPTRIFWPFLEGFEQGLESWRWLAPEPEPGRLKTDPLAKNGHAALLVSVPAGKRSVTIATTRVRGRELVTRAATGLRIWLRTRHGSGQARFTLLADALTTNQVVAVSRQQAHLAPVWRKVDLAFDDFPDLPQRGVDLFTIEFIGHGPQDFLVDDLQLLGAGKVEPE